MNATLSDSAPGAPVRSCEHITPAAGLTSDGNGCERLFFFRQAKQRDRISQMVLVHKPTIRYSAMGMVNGGMTQTQVARELGINVATIRCRLARDRSEDALTGRELHRSRAEVILEPSGEDRNLKVALQKAPLNKSVGDKTD